MKLKHILESIAGAVTVVHILAPNTVTAQKNLLPQNIEIKKIKEQRDDIDTLLLTKERLDEIKKRVDPISPKEIRSTIYELLRYLSEQDALFDPKNCTYETAEGDIVVNTQILKRIAEDLPALYAISHNLLKEQEESKNGGLRLMPEAMSDKNNAEEKKYKKKGVYVLASEITEELIRRIRVLQRQSNETQIVLPEQALDELAQMPQVRWFLEAAEQRRGKQALMLSSLLKKELQKL